MHMHGGSDNAYAWSIGMYHMPLLWPMAGGKLHNACILICACIQCTKFNALSGTCIVCAAGMAEDKLDLLENKHLLTYLLAAGMAEDKLDLLENKQQEMSKMLKSSGNKKTGDVAARASFAKRSIVNNAAGAQVNK